MNRLLFRYVCDETNGIGLVTRISHLFRHILYKPDGAAFPVMPHTEAVLDLSFLPLKIYFHSSIDRVRKLPLIPPTVKSAFALGSVALVLIIILVRCCQQTHLSGYADQDDE